MRQSFMNRLLETHDKASLIAWMNELDQEKRAIKQAMRRYSSETPENGGLSGSQRYSKLRRMKDRLEHLKEEREAVRLKLGKLKRQQKSLNKATNRKIVFCQAFVAAAEIELSPDQYLQLELKAMEMLTNHKANE